MSVSSCEIGDDRSCRLVIPIVDITDCFLQVFNLRSG